MEYQFDKITSRTTKRLFKDYEQYNHFDRQSSMIRPDDTIKATTKLEMRLGNRRR